MANKVTELTDDIKKLTVDTNKKIEELNLNLADIQQKLTTHGNRIHFLNSQGRYFTPFDKIWFWIYGFIMLAIVAATIYVSFESEDQENNSDSTWQIIQKKIIKAALEITIGVLSFVSIIDHIIRNRYFCI